MLNPSFLDPFWPSFLDSKTFFSGNFQTETQPLIDLEDFELRNPHKNH